MKKTYFHYLTLSADILAEKLVHRTDSKGTFWTSTITKECYPDRVAALKATLQKLNEEFPSKDEEN